MISDLFNLMRTTFARMSGPPIKRTIQMVKSEDDFMRFHLPWYL